MVLLIDACNIRAGGGQVHLIELLKSVKPQDYGFKRIIVCAPNATLAKIEDSSNVEKYAHRLINGNYFQQWKWRKYVLRDLVSTLNAFLFIPGALKPPFRWPYVTMCQNLLPLEYKELLRYKVSLVTLRLLFLRYLHLRTFKYSSGTIFLTKYCLDILTCMGRRVQNASIIPHGINHKLFQPVALKPYVKEDGEWFKLLYVSILDVYKHQDKVSAAVINLNKQGYKVKITFVGPAYGPSKRKIDKIINFSANLSNTISYRGPILHQQLIDVYSEHHAFIFASTCETFGMIVTEAMAAGMPILCTEKSSLKETVGDAALYFDPLNIRSIEEKIIQLMNNESLRQKLATSSQHRSRSFSWEKSGDLTFSYLSKTAKNCGF
jgi:glycosyltransferase involved in cell wall biosynthesis